VIEDAEAGDVADFPTVEGRQGPGGARLSALKKGELAVVSLAAGAGSRWTQGRGW